MADSRARVVEAGQGHPDPMVRTVVEFMDTPAAKTDPAFNVPSIYDNQRAVYRPRRSIKLSTLIQILLKDPRPCRTDISHSDLHDALLFYGKLGIGPKVEHAVESASWEDILGQITRARETYESKAEGLKGLARKLWRKAGDTADTIAPVLDMIPDDMYLKVLRIGLSWVLSLAQAAAKKREAIFAAFEEIPALFIKAAAKKKAFSDDKELCERLLDVHATAAWAVSKLIVFLLPKSPFKQAFPAIFSVPTAEEVDILLAKVKTKAHELQERVDSLVELAIADIQKTSHRNETSLSVIRQSVTRTDVQTRNITRDISHLSSSIAPVAALPAKVGELLEHITAREAAREVREAAASKAHLQAVQHGIDAQNGMKDHLLDVMATCKRLESQVEEMRLERYDLIRQLTERSVTPTPPMSMNPAFAPFALPMTPAPPAYYEVMTLPQLLTALSVDVEALTTDLETIYAKHASFTDGYTSRASLLTHPRLQQWLAATHSDIVVIDTPQGDPATLSRLDPLSAFCATLVASLREAQPAAEVLHYFCGLHADDAADELAGPAGLLRALLSRILLALYRRGILNLGFVASREYRTGLEEWDIDILSDALVRLVRRFELNTFVYVIVDGASWCERNEAQRGDMAVVMDALAVLMEEQQQLRPILKVLVTSPVRSRVAAKSVDVENVVRVPGPAEAYGEDDEVAARMMKMAVNELMPPPPVSGVHTGGVLAGMQGRRDEYLDDEPTGPDYWT